MNYVQGELGVIRYEMSVSVTDKSSNQFICTIIQSENTNNFMLDTFRN